MNIDGRSDAEVLAAAGLNLGERQGTDGSTETVIGGNTDAFRHLLRGQGGAWDKLKRVWVFAGDAAPSRLAEANRAEPPPATGLAEDLDKPHYWGHRQRLRERFMD
ncbi:MAG: hypothetical protein VW405_15225 [Rhodospirillaceae bacterium]